MSIEEENEHKEIVMGLFRRRKNKQIEPEPKVVEDISPRDLKRTLKEACDQVIICDKKAQDAKVEYDAVTSYLSDMQRIELIPLTERFAIEDSARKIINLTKERKKFQNRTRNISDLQYKTMEQYEVLIPGVIQKLKKEESFKILIEEDIKKVEQEREKIEGEQQDIINKQSTLKTMAIGIGVVIAFVFITFVLLSSLLEFDVKLPFTLFGVMVFLVAVLILNESHKNQYKIRVVDGKRKRALQLYNKLAIKAVNNRSYLEYTFDKYMTQGGEELQRLFEEYLELKDEARRYQSNTELLNFYQNELIGGLSNAGVVDSEIWIYQAEAILDKKEMVEVRHRLNVRRQKLREVIEANAKLKENLLKEVEHILEQNPDISSAGMEFIGKYSMKND